MTSLFLFKFQGLVFWKEGYKPECRRLVFIVVSASAACTCLWFPAGEPDRIVMDGVFMKCKRDKRVITLKKVTEGDIASCRSDVGKMSILGTHEKDNR